MQPSVSLAVGAAALVLAGGSVFALDRVYRRPAMPAFAIDLRSPPGHGDAMHLMLIYDRDGHDPFRPGSMTSSQRISGCRTIGTRCVSESARMELGPADTRRQSLQIRVLNGAGNPILGGVTWTGPARPARLSVTCDLAVGDVRKACAVAG